MEAGRRHCHVRVVERPENGVSKDRDPRPVELVPEGLGGQGVRPGPPDLPGPEQRRRHALVALGEPWRLGGSARDPEKPLGVFAKPGPDKGLELGPGHRLETRRQRVVEVPAHLPQRVVYHDRGDRDGSDLGDDPERVVQRVADAAAGRAQVALAVLLGAVAELVEFGPLRVLAVSTR